jgi:hypothetical protein
VDFTKVLENISSLFGTVPIPIGITLFSLLVLTFITSMVFDKIEENKKINKNSQKTSTQNEQIPIQKIQTKEISPASNLIETSFNKENTFKNKELNDSNILSLNNLKNQINVS